MRKFAGSLKIITMLNQLYTQRPHGGIFLNTIAMWYYNGGRNPVTLRCVTNRLAMIATGCANHALWHLLGLCEMREVNKASPDLESPHRSVIFMLYPNFRTQVLTQ
jgi:hypothetical protein